MELLLPIVLIVLGLGLILAEVYLVPGFNVVGILGVLVIVFGIGFVFSEVGMIGGVIALLSTLAAGGGMFYTLWKNGAWDRFVLAANLRGDEARIARESEHRSRYLGKPGVAVTPLRPTGVVEIDGERIEVQTEGDFVAAGSRVRVVAINRRQYFVRLENLLADGAAPSDS
ncbi:MAG: NfeD family protein [Bacteroidota bacterium]